jgi:hypothetical protein
MLLLGLTGMLLAQAELIELSNEPVAFEADGFYIKKVTDVRANKDSIGFAQKGLFKKEKVPARFKDGLGPAIFNYLKKNFRQDSAGVPIIMRVTYLHVSEKLGVPITGAAEIKMEFLRDKDGSVGRLYEAEAFVEKPAMNVTKTHEQRIREVIVSCLESFNESDWKSISPVYFKEEEKN